MSDFPEFDAAYKSVLVKDSEDRFDQLAAEANFNIYHSDIWRGTARRFGELIVRECASRCGELGNPELGQGIMKHFGVDE